MISNQWIVAAVFLLNVCLMVWETIRISRLSRANKQTTVLNLLLASLCVQAFSRQHMPIWRAWAATMGEIDVQVIPRHKMEGTNDAVR